MPESFKTRTFRWFFNFFPAFRGSGGRVAYIADDWQEVRMRLPLSWRTRNYVGTIYGGSIYSSIDPIYMLMLMNILGKGYVVWDKAASIRFRKPGKTTLYADFILTAEEIAEIKRLAAVEKSIDRIYNVELKDVSGLVYATIEKTLYIAKKV
jgi:acyl-coenzyme A thioesterase PaaI-like protein